MKNRVAVVVGALVMFVSGYILGYTTAIPDFLRTSDLDVPDGESPGLEDMILDVTEQVNVGGAATDFTNDMTNEEANSLELQELKKMIVPMLTDEEIKKIRADAAAEAAAAPVAAPIEPAEDTQLDSSQDNPATEP